MTTQQDSWILKIVAFIIIGVFLFIFKSQWEAVEALEFSLANHREDAAKSYVTRQEMIQVIREILRSASRPN